MFDRAFGLLLQYPDDHGEVARPAADHREGARRWRARRGGERSDGAHAAGAAGRNGRRRRHRQLAAFRRAARLRRPARGVLRDQGRVRPPGAGADHRRLGRRARAARLPDGAADARAAHPPREGDLEHLHRPGAAGQHRRDVRGVPRPARPARDWRANPRHGARARRRAGRAGIAPDQRGLLRHAARRGGERRRRPRGGANRPASTSATSPTARSGFRSTRRRRSTTSPTSSRRSPPAGSRSFKDGDAARR